MKPNALPDGNEPMNHALRRLLPVLILCAGLGALPAGAEELGQVRFTFDGAEKTWFTVIRNIKGKSRPSAKLKSTRTGDTIKIEAFPDPAAPSLESVTIALIYVRSPTMSGEPDYARPASRKIDWVLEGFTGPRWKGRKMKVQLTTVDLAGDMGRLAGTFSAELCHAAGIYDKVDESSCQLVSGTIDTKVVRDD